MKFKSISIAALAAFTLAGAANAATTISYSAQTIANSTDTSWVSPAGYTSVAAFNMGGGTVSFGGLSWFTTNPNAAQNIDTDIDMSFHAPGNAWALNHPSFYGSSTASTILNTGNYSGYVSGGVEFRIDLNGFTVGQEYLVQFVLADSRAGIGVEGRQIGIYGYSSNISGQDSGNYQYAFGDDRYLVVTAQFTPSPGDTDFAFRPGINTGAGLQVNAIQVLTVPEPSAALLGGLGLLALLRRRR
ncbi:MAG: hypothetical protein RLZZ505_1715 [Verrucomicrobiota bacterium]|jgi:hypothetical protein